MKYSPFAMVFFTLMGIGPFLPVQVNSARYILNRTAPGLTTNFSVSGCGTFNNGSNNSLNGLSMQRTVSMQPNNDKQPGLATWINNNTCLMEQMGISCSDCSSYQIEISI